LKLNIKAGAGVENMSESDAGADTGAYLDDHYIHFNLGLPPVPYSAFAPNPFPNPAYSTSASGNIVSSLDSGHHVLSGDDPHRGFIPTSNDIYRGVSPAEWEDVDNVVGSETHNFQLSRSSAHY
jgi:hypothetical protein